jgi:hypothetical protein
VLSLLGFKLIPLRKGGDEGVVCTTLHFEVLELLGTDKQRIPLLGGVRGG